MAGATMRIAYLCSEYPAISHTFVLREIQQLRARGMTVLTATIRPPAGLARMGEMERAEAAATLCLKRPGFRRLFGAHSGLLARRPVNYLAMFVRALRLGSAGCRPALRQRLGYFAEAGVLVHWLQAEEVSHVHVHFANPAATVAMLAGGWPGLSYSLSVHGPDVFYNVDTAMLRAKIAGARFVRCISHFCRSQVMGQVAPAFWPRLHIVRCGVDPAAFAPRRQPHNATPRILCVGRLVGVKGQRVLLDVCIALKRAGESFHLTFVGDGPERRPLEAAADELGDAVTFTGAVGQDEVRRLYDTAELFVLPSFAEGVPVVLMEAMAKSIAIVSSRAQGIPELVDHDVNGLLTAPGDAAALAAAIERLLHDAELRRRFGEQGREKVVRCYDLDRNCGELALLFARCLGAADGRKGGKE